jgi:hypothetical protein
LLLSFQAEALYCPVGILEPPTMPQKNSHYLPKLFDVLFG